MVRSRAGRDRSATAILWSGRWIILGTVCAFGGAALLMSAMLPDRYKARIRLDPRPEVVASAQILATDAVLPGRTGLSRLDQVLADARAALEGRSVGERRDGIEVGANGAVTAWAEADSREAAQAAVLAIADRVEAASADPPSGPASSDVPSRTEGLRAEAENAARERDALAREVERLRSAEAASSEPDRPELEAGIRADEARAQDLRRRIAVWRQAARELRAGNADGGELSALSGWSAFRSLAEERRRLGERIEEMSRTLLDAHPRMVIARLRLDDVAGELQPLQGRLLGEAEAELRRMEREAGELDRAIAGGRERLAAAAEAGRALTEAETALRVAQDVAARLEAAAQAGAGDDAGPPALAEAPREPAWTRSEVHVERSRMSPWPSAAAGAGIGFIASTLGLLAVGLIGPRRREGGSIEDGGEVVAAKAGDAPPVPDERAAAMPGAELASVDDVIDAIVSSGVARTMLVTVGEGGSRPLSVDIVRRLALRGRSTVLVDLSPDQRAARSMGASADHPGLRDLIDGRATFASIARHDFATQADIVPYGSEPADKRLDTPQERRNVLDFIERSYDVLLVDCGRMTPAEITELMDSDAALLVAIGKATAEEGEAAIGRLRDAGLDDLIVVREALPA